MLTHWGWDKMAAIFQTTFLKFSAVWPIEHVTLIAINGAFILVPYLSVKSLQLIWRSGTCTNLLVPVTAIRLICPIPTILTVRHQAWTNFHLSSKRNHFVNVPIQWDTMLHCKFVMQSFIGWAHRQNDPRSKDFWCIPLTTILQEELNIFIHKMSFKITVLNLQPNLPGDNVLSNYAPGDDETTLMLIYNTIKRYLKGVASMKVYMSFHSKYTASKIGKNIYRSDVQVTRFTAISDIYRSFIPNKTTFTEYCLTQSMYHFEVWQAP